MRVAMCWGGVSGYMAACWREFAARPGVDLLVVNFDRQFDTAFELDVMRGVPHTSLPVPQKGSAERLRDLLLEHRPDVVSVSGWAFPEYIRLASDPAFARVPFVMVMDNPLTRTLRQRLGRMRVRPYLNRMSRVIVPGERAWQYARYLGVPERRIRRGMYGVDFDGWAPLHAEREKLSGGWPRRFLFAGRYTSMKRLDILVDGYARYRELVDDPFTLQCSGMGPLRYLLDGREGVEDLGFVQPSEMRDVMRQAGAFVLASDFDPWPLVVVEASAAGLPVVCSEACGSAVEVVRTAYSGMTVNTGDAAALSEGLVWVHKQHAQLPEIGRRAQELAAAYSAQAWADRWECILAEGLA